MTVNHLSTFPDDLPIPEDDRQCDHLPGVRVPSIALPSTAGGWVDLAEPTARRVVVFCYPRTGTPDRPVPAGWDAIPGARGCTPQSCGFRDRFAGFRAFDADVYGLSTQTTEYQREMAERLHLPFAVLSDAALRWTTALRLPTFAFAGETLIKRLALVIERGVVVKVFYPVFPPDRNAGDVLAWLKDHAGESPEQSVTAGG